MNNHQDNDSRQDDAMETSFADLFEAGNDKAEKSQLAPGQKVKARIVSIGEEWLFLDVGRKSEGCLARHELEDENGELTVKMGDTIEAYFLSAEHQEMMFTTRLGGSASRAHLEEAFRGGIPVEGLVKEEIKGGFAVMIGAVRAFCPYSQMDIRRVGEAAVHLEQRYPFRITEYSENGRNILVSRRVLLEEERDRKKEELRETLKVGMTVKGRITSIRDFGAFVDLDGLEGLIPISEIGWARVEDVREYLTEGQEVEVVALKLDWESDRYSFSLKQALANPWDQVHARYPVGSVHAGTVARLVPFGAFVTLEPGVDGLVHISHLGAGRRINHPREVVAVGQVIEVRVDGIDLEKKRISLAPAGAEAEAAAEETAEPSEAEVKSYIKRAAAPAGPTVAKATLGDLLKEQMRRREKK